MRSDNVERVNRARQIAIAIGNATSCPDPAEGGCIGGPIPSYGCVNEAARALLRCLDEVLSTEMVPWAEAKRRLLKPRKETT